MDTPPPYTLEDMVLEKGRVVGRISGTGWRAPSSPTVIPPGTPPVANRPNWGCPEEEEELGAFAVSPSLAPGRRAVPSIDGYACAVALPLSKLIVNNPSPPVSVGGKNCSIPPLVVLNLHPRGAILG